MTNYFDTYAYVDHQSLHVGADHGFHHDASSHESPHEHSTHSNPTDIFAMGEFGHFSAETALHHDVVGNPGHDMANWHEQEASDTCGIVSQEFILHDFGIPTGEHTLTKIAEQNGFYHAGAGTPLNQVGSLLGAFGLPVHRESHMSLDGLVDHLKSGDKVVVAVDAHDIWHDDKLSAFTPSFLQHANHVVQVTGVVDHGTPHAMVVLNDPGHPEGCGMLVPEHEFSKAWETSGCFAASVPGGALPDMHPADVLFPALRATIDTAAK